MGYDYPHQIMAYEAVKNQILGGEIYPRWLSEINKGFGGTNLFFYSPLTYYSGLLVDSLTFFKLSTLNVIIGNVILLCILSGLSFYVFARRITSAGMSCALALLYAVLPYHLLYEIYARTALSEFAAYIWIPLLFHFVRPSMQNSRKQTIGFALSYAALILTHLPTAVFTTIFIGAYALAQNFQIRERKLRIQYTIHFISTSFFATCLAGFFIYPAITMLEYTNYEVLWQGQYDYRVWFLSPFSYKSCPIDHACMFLTLISIFQIILPIAVFLMMYKKSSEAIDQNKFTYLGLCLLCFFLMTPLSSFVWAILPPLQKIQFPWRLLLMSDFLLLALLTALSRHINFKKTFCIVVTLYIFLSLILVAYLQKSEYKDIDNSIQNRIDANVLTPEHIPNNDNMTYNSLQEFQDAPAFPKWLVIDGRADLTLNFHSPREISFNVKAESPSTLQIRQFNFAGWVIKKDSHENISSQANMRGAKPFGQLEFEIPQGDYELTVEIPTMREELIGWLISALSLIATIFMVSWMPFREKATQ